MYIFKCTLIYGCLLLMATAGFSQTAKVIALDPADAAQARALYDKVEAAKQEMADFQNKMRDKYTIVGAKDKDRSNMAIYSGNGLIWGCFRNGGIMVYVHGDGYTATSQDDEAAYQKCLKEQKAAEAKLPPPRYYRQGWENGFEYSADFKFIVPVPCTPSNKALDNRWFINSTSSNR